jgi:diaminopimelate epimerase
MQLSFYKYHGTGNDFILIDNRNNQVQLSNLPIAHLCHRRFGIGADGLMLLNQLDGYDFEMKYFNSDGAEGSMCGNGGRCLTQFAYDMGIHKNHYYFIAPDGPHEAIIENTGWVKLKMKDVNAITQQDNAFILNTGSPHYIQPVTKLNELDVFTAGQKIRYSNQFKEQGINVNFVEQDPNGSIKVRTYERGVEDETYSCGTGVTAAALTHHNGNLGFHKIQIFTKGGNLSVEFEKIADQTYQHIWLCGPASFVFKGTIAF